MIANFSQTFRGILVSKLSLSLSSFITYLTKKAPNRALNTMLYASSAYKKESSDLDIDETYIQFYYPHPPLLSIGTPIPTPSSTPNKQAQILLLTMNRRIKIKQDFVPILSQQIQEQPCPEELTLPFKPFYMKFQRMKANLTHHRCHTEEEVLDLSGRSDQLLSKRILTEGQTNDFYASDFQSESESLSFRETVQEQNQILGQTASYHYSQLPLDIFSEQSYTSYSPTYLRKRNRQLINYIQYFRSVLPTFKANILTLHKQRHELQKLYDLKDKVFDYSYELHIDRSQHRNLTASKIQKKSIKQCSGVFVKQRYLSIREALRKANPTVFEIHYSSSNTNKPRRLSIKQEDLIAKKRQYYKYQQKIKFLQEKINEYVRRLDVYDNILSKGDVAKLSIRKQNLESQIQSKKTAISIKEIELNLQVTNFNNQLARVDARLIEISKQKRSIKEKVFESRLKNQSTLVRGSKKQYLIKQPKTNRIPSLKYTKAITTAASQPEIPGRTPTAIEKFIDRNRKAACSTFAQNQFNRFQLP